MACWDSGCCLGGSAQRPEHLRVQTEGLPVRGRGPVRNAEFFCRLLDDGGQLPQVNVADLREQVVLDLVI